MGGRPTSRPTTQLVGRTGPADRYLYVRKGALKSDTLEVSHGTWFAQPTRASPKRVVLVTRASRTARHGLLLHACGLHQARPGARASETCNVRNSIAPLAFIQRILVRGCALASRGTMRVLSTAYQPFKGGLSKQGSWASRFDHPQSLSGPQGLSIKQPQG